MRLVPGLPRLVDGKYRVDRALGRGGMGAVFRARDVRLDRDVALKVVKADLLSNPDARSRFRREAQVVAKLQHPSIVSIFDYGSLPDGGAFLVMEFVHGRDLRAALREHGPYAAQEAVRLMHGVCAAIDAAHAAGVLHRDLKPENILLPEGRSDVKVLDFGIAKLVAEAHMKTTETIGTPLWMAPEQTTSGAAISPATDLHELGATKRLQPLHCLPSLGVG
jgi:serine/threonine-protein kinase